MPSNLDWVIEALDAGFTLSIPSFRGERRFTRGQITRDVRSNGDVRSTHTLTTGSGISYIMVSRKGIAFMAEQAKAINIQAERERERREMDAFFDR